MEHIRVEFPNSATAAHFIQRAVFSNGAPGFMEDIVGGKQIVGFYGFDEQIQRTADFLRSEGFDPIEY